MDKQIIKTIIIEKHVGIPSLELTLRKIMFGDKDNYVLVGL